MKKIILFFALFAMCLGVKAQWDEYHTWNRLSCGDLYFSSNLYSIDFYRHQESECYYSEVFYIAVGANGVITKSGIELESNTQEDLYRIKIVDDSIAYIIGAHGTILKSMDRGQTWLPIGVEMSFSLYAISTLGADTCWVAGGDTFHWDSVPGGSRGVLMRTTDGGITWDIDSSFNYAINDVLIVSDTLGYIVQTSDRMSRLLCSNDTGNTFSQVNTGIEIFDDEKITDISYADGRIWLCTYPSANVYYSKIANTFVNENRLKAYKIYPLDNGYTFALRHINLPDNEPAVSCLYESPENQEYDFVDYFYACGAKIYDLCVDVTIADDSHSFNANDMFYTYVWFHGIALSHEVSEYTNDLSPTIGHTYGYITSSIKSEKLNISVCPNPANTSFNIIFDTMEKCDCKYYIYDIQGRMVDCGEIDKRESSKVININEYTIGLYYVIIKRGNEIIYSEKIIKE